MFTLNLKGNFALKVSLPPPVHGVDLCLAQILENVILKVYFRDFM